MHGSGGFFPAQTLVLAFLVVGLGVLCRGGIRGRIDDLDAQITGQTDLILDAGRLKGGIGSTVVDVTDERLQIIREGEVSAEEIQSVLE